MLEFFLKEIEMVTAIIGFTLAMVFYNPLFGSNRRFPDLSEYENHMADDVHFNGKENE